MNAKKISQNGKITTIIVFFSLLSLGYKSLNAQSNENSGLSLSEDERNELQFDPAKNFRLDITLMGGGGFNNFEVGETEEAKTIRLSPGGGVGAKFNLGYCLSSKFNINLEFGTQKATLSEKCDNADGCFKRSHILGTLRYRIPITNSGSINIGSGFGFYMGGKFDLEFQDVPGGAHTIFEYGNASGIHILGEYEKIIPNFSFLNSNWTWSIGLKYYNVFYDINFASLDGISIPTSYVENSWSNIDGSGLDIFFSIATYL